MRSILILSCFAVLFLSCGKKKCDVSNPSKLKWEPIDSIISYFACTNSSNKLQPENEVTVTYEGAVNKEGKLVPLADSSEILYLPDLLLGKHKFTEFGEYIQLKPVLNKMGRNAEYYLKYELPSPRKPGQEIHIYLNETADSAQAIEWISKLPFVRSVKYTSKEEALQLMQQDIEDLDFTGITETNPLPNTLIILLTLHIGTVASWTALSMFY